MLCAYHSGNQTIITCADTLDAFEDLAARLAAASDGVYEVARPTGLERMTVDHLGRFDPEIGPIIVTHASEAARDAFCALNGISIVGPNRAHSYYMDMIRPALAAKSEDDNRTIAEILGIDKDDPWDHRSEEEKAALAEAAAKGKKAYADAHKQGQLSGESFGGGGSKDGTPTITDINASVGADGRLQINTATAVKGLHDVDPAERRKLLIEQATKDAAHEDYVTAIATGARHSTRASDYVAAVIEREGHQPHIVVAPRVHWFTETTLDGEHYGAALHRAIAGFGWSELLEGNVFVAEQGTFDDAVEAAGKAGFVLSTKLARYYRNVHLGEDIAWKDEDVVAKPPEDPSQNLDENGDDLMVTPDKGNFDYFKTEVTGAKLAQVEPILAQAGIRLKGQVYRWRDNTAGCWFVCIMLKFATKIEEAVRAAGLEAETYQVNNRGDRLVAKVAGVKPVDVNAQDEIGPRPWNDRSAEWHALSDEDKEKNRKTWKGKEFLVTGTDMHPLGIVIWVTPESYFRKHGTAYPERIDIKHLLPDFMREIEPWTFYCTDESKDWNTVSFLVENKAKFQDDLDFTVWHNNRNM